MQGSFTVPGKQLAEAVKYAARWMPRRPTIPIHAGLLFQVGDGDGGGLLTIFGYSDNATGGASCPVEGDARGTFVVSGRLIEQLVATFGAKPVTFLEKGSAVQVTAGSWRGELPTMSAMDFPSIPQAAPAVGVVDGAALADAARRVAGAAGNDPEQTGLLGLYVELGSEEDGQRLTMMATDRYQVSVQHIEWAPDPDAPIGSVAFPHASQVRDAIDAYADGEVTIGWQRGTFSLSSATRSLVVSELGEPEKFPAGQCRAVLATERPSRATFDRAVLAEPLKRARILHDQGFGGKHPQVQLDFGPDGSTVTAATGGDAKGAEPFDVEFEGPEMTIIFRSEWLAGALSSAPGDVVTLNMLPASGRPAPCVISCDEDPSWQHIMMPVYKAQ